MSRSLREPFAEKKAPEFNGRSPVFVALHLAGVHTAQATYVGPLELHMWTKDVSERRNGGKGDFPSFNCNFELFCHFVHDMTGIGANSTQVPKSSESIVLSI